jgi:hypothetical protein
MQGNEQSDGAGDPSPQVLLLMYKLAAKIGHRLFTLAKINRIKMRVDVRMLIWTALG